MGAKLAIVLFGPLAWRRPTWDSVWVVSGTVRRGEFVAFVTQHEFVPCDGCGRMATGCATSPKGRITNMCGDCVVSCGQPTPPVVSGLNGETVVCDSVAAVRRAVAGGTKFSSVQAFKLAEEYEAAKRRWDKQTRKHGFKRVEADPRKRQSKSLWSPYGN